MAPDKDRRWIFDNIQLLNLFKEVNNSNPKKSPGYDLITGKIPKELSIIKIKYLTQLLNAVLLKGYFRAQ
jgi:hypothetical protein